MKPPHLHHTCHVWHICFVPTSVRTFSSDVECRLRWFRWIRVTARKLPVSLAVFLPSPFWPNVEPSPPQPNLANDANGQPMGKLAKPTQPLSKRKVDNRNVNVALLTSSHVQALALSSTSFPFCFLAFEGAGGSNSSQEVIYRDSCDSAKAAKPSIAPSHVLFFSRHFWLAEPTGPKELEVKLKT